MTRLLPFAVCLLLVASPFALAHPYFAVITAVDAEKGTVVYTITFGKDKDQQVKATVVKGCVIKAGSYILGKPARTEEGGDIPNGLKNKTFKAASAENPLQVNVFTADEDNLEKGIRRGDLIKILVNPKPRD
jgi:hypothetical protein